MTNVFESLAKNLAPKPAATAGASQTAAADSSEFETFHTLALNLTSNSPLLNADMDALMDRVCSDAYRSEQFDRVSKTVVSGILVMCRIVRQAVIFILPLSPPSFSVDDDDDDDYMLACSGCD